MGFKGSKDKQVPQPSQLVPLAPLLTSPKLLIEVAGSRISLEGLKLSEAVFK